MWEDPEQQEMLSAYVCEFTIRRSVVLYNWCIQLLKLSIEELQRVFFYYKNDRKFIALYGFAGYGESSPDYFFYNLTRLHTLLEAYLFINKPRVRWNFKMQRLPWELPPVLFFGDNLKLVIMAVKRCVILKARKWVWRQS